MTHSIFVGLVIASAAFTSLAAAQESAATFPSRAVELVVPFPAGGSTDVIARLVGQIVSEEWKQPMIIQNRVGAGGALASEFVVRSPADGYTLLAASASTHAVLPAYRSDLPFDTVTSFAPATLIATFPNMLVVNPKKLPVNSVAELIAYLKANPGKVNYASGGAGNTGHFASEMFKLMSKTDMIHVPYRGNAPALNDLMAGHVDLMIENMTSVWPQVQLGTLRALGVASLTRTPLAPDVPAIAETLPGYAAESWIAIVANAGTPPVIVDKIAKTFADAVKRPDIAQRLQELGGTAAYNTPKEMVTYITADRDRWRRVAAEANLAAAK